MQEREIELREMGGRDERRDAGEGGERGRRLLLPWTRASPLGREDGKRGGA